MCGSIMPVCITVDAVPMLRVRSTIAVILVGEICHRVAITTRETETRSRRSTFDRSRGLIKGNYCAGLEQFSCALSSQQRTVRTGSQIGEFLLEKVGTVCKCMRVYVYMYVCIARKREGKRDTRETCMYIHLCVDSIKRINRKQ